MSKQLEALRKKEDKLREELNETRDQVWALSQEEESKNLQKYIGKYLYNSDYKRYYKILRVRKDSQQFSFVTFILDDYTEYDHYSTGISDIYTFEIFEHYDYARQPLKYSKDIKEISEKEFNKVWTEVNLKIAGFLGLNDE